MITKEDVLKEIQHSIEILQTLSRHVEQKKRVGAETIRKSMRVGIAVTLFLDHEFKEEKKRRKRLGIPNIPDVEVDKLISDIIKEEEERNK